MEIPQWSASIRPYRDGKAWARPGNSQVASASRPDTQEGCFHSARRSFCKCRNFLHITATISPATSNTRSIGAKRLNAKSPIISKEAKSPDKSPDSHILKSPAKSPDSHILAIGRGCPVSWLSGLLAVLSFEPRFPGASMPKQRGFGCFSGIFGDDPRTILVKPVAEMKMWQSLNMILKIMPFMDGH